jgi:hypothetical protein
MQAPRCNARLAGMLLRRHAKGPGVSDARAPSIVLAEKIAASLPSYQQSRGISAGLYGPQSPSGDERLSLAASAVTNRRHIKATWSGHRRRSMQRHRRALAAGLDHIALHHYAGHGALVLLTSGAISEDEGGILGLSDFTEPAHKDDADFIENHQRSGQEG